MLWSLDMACLSVMKIAWTDWKNAANSLIILFLSKWTESQTNIMAAFMQSHEWWLLQSILNGSWGVDEEENMTEGMFYVPIINSWLLLLLFLLGEKRWRHAWVMKCEKCCGFIILAGALSSPFRNITSSTVDSKHFINNSEEKTPCWVSNHFSTCTRLNFLLFSSIPFEQRIILHSPSSSSSSSSWASSPVSLPIISFISYIILITSHTVWKTCPSLNHVLFSLS